MKKCTNWATVEMANITCPYCEVTYDYSGHCAEGDEVNCAECEGTFVLGAEG